MSAKRRYRVTAETGLTLSRIVRREYLIGVVIIVLIIGTSVREVVEVKCMRQRSLQVLFVWHEQKYVWGRTKWRKLNGLLMACYGLQFWSAFSRFSSDSSLTSRLPPPFGYSQRLLSILDPCWLRIPILNDDQVARRRSIDARKRSMGFIGI